MIIRVRLGKCDGILPVDPVTPILDTTTELGPGDKMQYTVAGGLVLEIEVRDEESQQ